MDNQKLIRFLTNSNLVSLATSEAIAESFAPGEFDKNSFLLKEGKVCNEYLFLESGFMRAFAHDTEGNDVTTGFYTGNQVVFEVSSFFNRIPSSENIQATEDSCGWSISYEQLNHLF